METLIEQLYKARDLYRRMQERVTVLRVYNLKPEDDIYYYQLQQEYKATLESLSQLIPID